MRIRHEIISTMYRNPHAPVKIPTSMELARRFGVARCTVTDELKKLSDEGFLVGRRGIGTFTNPDKSRSCARMPGRRTVGILVGDGQWFSNDYTSWTLLSAAGNALLPDIGHPRSITLTERSPELVCEELKLLNIDGLIWILPDPEMLPCIGKLRAEGMPIATIYRCVEGVPGVEMDFERQGREIADILLAEGRRRILWCAFDCWAEASRLGAAERFASAGIDGSGIATWREPWNFERRLETSLNSGERVDAIYVHGEFVSLVMEELEKRGINPFEDIALVASYGVIRKIRGFKGVVRREPFEEIGERAAQSLKRQFAAPKDRSWNHETVHIGVERWK